MHATCRIFVVVMFLPNLLFYIVIIYYFLSLCDTCQLMSE